MYQLNGKIALVTGAATKPGIGHAIAVRLAKEGADVAVVDRYLPPEGLSEDDHIEGWQGLNSVVEEIKALGREAIAIKTDITDSQQVKEMAARALEKFGKVDILINNAGTGDDYAPVIELNEQTWSRIVAINLTGTFLCCKYIAKSMVERGEGGKIVNVASLAGKAGVKDRSAYSSSKFGVIGLTESLALELAPFKINVNAICPGPVPTDFSSMGRGFRADARRLGISVDEAAKRRFADGLARIPMGRLARGEDMANAVAFLVSAESEFVTGLAIPVAGGLMF